LISANSQEAAASVANVAKMEIFYFRAARKCGAVHSLEE
jgi:hypothetical protein